MTLIRALQLYIPHRKIKKPTLNTNQVDVIREHAMPSGVRICQNIGRLIGKSIFQLLKRKHAQTYRSSTINYTTYSVLILQGFAIYLTICW